MNQMVFFGETPEQVEQKANDWFAISEHKNLNVLPENKKLKKNPRVMWF